MKRKKRKRCKVSWSREGMIMVFLQRVGVVGLEFHNFTASVDGL